MRIVRFKIAEGKFENIITNLPADEFPPDEIKHIYHLRWGKMLISAFFSICRYFRNIGIWKIEEYFRCKKQVFQFENFRVRKLISINALNFYITLCMAFLTMISMKSETDALKVSIIRTADPVKEKVFFCYYRLAKGISGILPYAREGVRLWFRTKRPVYRQFCLKLNALIGKRIVLPKPGSGGAY